MTEIHAIPLGFDTCYVLRGEGVIVLDAGQPKKGRAFLRGLSRAGIEPSEVDLILLTHAHWDHMGSAAEIKRLTGAPLAVHEREVGWVERGDPPLPPGVTPWGRTFMAVHRAVMPLIHVPAATVDRVLPDEPLSLHDEGIPGRVIPTPGHSPGSVTVLLDSREAFVGDLAMNRVPLTRSPSLPIFADDPDQVIRSWRRLFEYRIETVFPAHGAPFPVDVIRRRVEVARRERASGARVPPAGSRSAAESTLT